MTGVLRTPGIRVVVAMCVVIAVASTTPGALATAATGLATRTDPRRLELPRPEDRQVFLEPGEASAVARAAATFLERHGGHWTFMTDPRTTRVVFAQGSGVPITTFAPAGRNRSVVTSRDSLVEAARAFVDAHPALLSPTVGELVLNEDATHIRGRLSTVHFDWQFDGVPVEGAAVFVRLNSNRITQFGSRFIAGVEIFPEPAVTADQARVALLTYSGDGEVARFVREPSLLVTPLERTGSDALDYRMVWRMSYRVPGRQETWEGRIDARTGAVIGFRDTNVYGQARGGVFPRSVWLRNETRAPLPFLRLSIGDTKIFADAAGRFTHDGGAIHARLNGRSLSTNCVSCTNPVQPSASEPFGAGIVDFGATGGDEIGNGYSTAAGRNVYYHTQQVRRIATKWLPTLRWVRRGRLTSNVNIPLSCNAFYSHEEQSVNFFRAGDGCSNTGLIADIAYHEWGHGLDFATLVLDGATGEGTADVVAMHMTRDPLIALGFHFDGRPIRDLNSATNALGFMTWARVEAGVCALPGGGISIHCIGTVYGQTAWDLARALVARHGEYTGWRISERLFYQSLPDAGSLDPESPFAIYSAYLQADDDDGNLANGTPNADLIHAAFASHGIAQARLPVGSAQLLPARPVATATPACDGIAVRWDPVENAVGYEVLRTELDPNGPLFSVTTRPAATDLMMPVIRDNAVAPGFDYRYAVIAVDANGRESTVEPGPPVRLPDRPLLSVHGVAVSDAGLGNRSGFWDPGETVEIFPTLTNAGDVPATQVSGRLEAITPGVSVIEGTTSWPDLAPGEAAMAESPLVVRVDDTVACGTTLEFRLVPEEAGDCADVETSWFSLQLGASDDRTGFVCDATPACFVEPLFSGLELAFPAGCGEVQLRWLPAESRCPNAEVRYDVFRGDEANFEPGPATRIASNVSVASWIDRLLVPGETYHYLVRAVDSRSGADDNTRVVSAVAPAGVDQAPPVFASEVSAVSGDACGESELRWNPALESCSLPVMYRVFRSIDPDFAPDPTTLVAVTTDVEYRDTGEPGITYHYIVHAVDDVGNAAPAASGASARSYVSDRLLTETGFEFHDAGWNVIEPNDAERGNWDWGDPEGDDFQPEDDATPNGARCWMTGISRLTPTGNNNDIDFGTTTLASARYDISDTVDPVVRYSRWFTNDRATNPGDPRDTLRVHVSDDDGIHWTLLEEVGAGTPLAWVPVELPLAGLVASTDRLRLRFTAADIGGSIEDASKVEAGVDEFSIIDRNQGCSTCDGAAQVMSDLVLRREGPDVVLEWGAASTSRYTIEMLGRDGTAISIGTARTNRFVHMGAAHSRTSFDYRVTARPLCGDP